MRALDRKEIGIDRHSACLLNLPDTPLEIPPAGWVFFGLSPLLPDSDLSGNSARVSSSNSHLEETHGKPIA